MSTPGSIMPGHMMCDDLWTWVLCDYAPRKQGVSVAAWCVYTPAYWPGIASWTHSDIFNI